MLNRNSLPIAIAVLIAAVAAHAAQSPSGKQHPAWGADAIPAPENAEHPGAAEAPASSPTTYPDAKGFAARARLVIDGLKTEDLGKWRKGYFAGGDPGKYLPGAAMAKLLSGDPKLAAEAKKYQNDNRAFKEHYHFAAVNWGRYLPLFGDTLTDETKQKVTKAASTYSAYLSPGGTENHKVMWMTTANVLPHYIDGGLARRNKKATLQQAKSMLRSYVKGLYAAGQGEWDSSTYLMFDVNGMLNIYDFSKDDECRLLAKAALDWYMTGYALKYTDGVYCAPNQRGYPRGPVQTIGDQTGWIWWDANGNYTAQDMRNSRYALHAITSSWRPNAVITNIARKNLPKLPAEFRNSKPNYWYGQGRKPQGSVYHETAYIAPQFTVASLWNGHGSQMTCFMVVASSDDGGIVFSGGNPRKSDHRGKKTDIGFADGTGRYTQYAQKGAAVISMSLCPDNDDAATYSYFTLPDDAKPQTFGKWTTIGAGNAVVALYPLGGKAVDTKSPPDRKGRTTRILKIDGKRSGFIAQVLPRDTPTALAKQLSSARIDDSRFAADMHVIYTSPDGDRIDMKFDPAPSGDAHGNRTADVVINGKAMSFGDWAVYDGPYIKHDKSVLSVNDGRRGFVVDFTGDLPVYRPWSK